MPPTPDIRPGANPAYPAGPSLLPRILTGQPFRQNSADFMLATARHFGDLNHYTAFGRHIYQLNHPDLIADLFLKDAPRHHRNLVMQRAADVLGHGLLTSEEPLHMRQRRLAQPAFLRDRIAAYAEVIGSNAIHLSSRWQIGTVQDLHPEMLELALRIVGKCLFDLDVLEDVAAIASAVDSFMSFVPLAFLPFSGQIQRLPIPAMQRLSRGKAHLDQLIYAMIAERRADPTDRGDLLSMLLNATDPEPDAAPVATGQGSVAPANSHAPVPSKAPSRMNDKQLHDECVTIILAGHETTANALSFAVHLLAQHPEIQRSLHAEAVAVLGDRTPTAADYARLPLATQVFAETMRLYPPVWVTARTCVEPYEIAGYRIPIGATLTAPQYAVQRDPRWFPDPDRFDPSRFTETNKSSRPRYSYFPFAGGSRQCIAEGLAWMEGTLVLAVITRDWQLSPAPGRPSTLRLNPAVSLRPKNGVPLRVDCHPTRQPFH